MTLKNVDFPSPGQLRGGWAALAAVLASRGWDDDVYAAGKKWFYHDGGGNWACLRIVEPSSAVLVGHDHEYSQTYFRDAATYFGEEETDLLKGAPDWWGEDIDRMPFGDWIGFIYGWNGGAWQRADYDASDGFEALNLKGACSIDDVQLIKSHAASAPGLNGKELDEAKLAVLVSADAEITPAMLEAVVPGWNIDAGVAAARKFLEATL